MHNHPALCILTRLHQLPTASPAAVAWAVAADSTAAVVVEAASTAVAEAAVTANPNS